MDSELMEEAKVEVGSTVVCVTSGGQYVEGIPEGAPVTVCGGCGSN